MFGVLQIEFCKASFLIFVKPYICKEAFYCQVRAPAVLHGGGVADTYVGQWLQDGIFVQYEFIFGQIDFL